MSRVNAVELNSPPMTTSASGWLMNAPPPVASTTGPLSRMRAITRASPSRKYGSPWVSKISGIVMSAAVSISVSASVNGSFSRAAEQLDHARAHPTPAQRGEVPPEAARLADAGHVVEQPEQAAPDAGLDDKLDVVKALVDGALGKLGVGPEALFSTLGRVAARGLETALLAEKMGDWVDELAENMGRGELRIHDNDKWEPSSWPASATAAARPSGAPCTSTFSVMRSLAISPSTTRRALVISG